MTPVDLSGRPLYKVRILGVTVATMLTGNEEPKPLPMEVIPYYPVYTRHPMAVYELQEGTYTTTKHGEYWWCPFETTDLELAIDVCNRWAKEFHDL